MKIVRGLTVVAALCVAVEPAVAQTAPAPAQVRAQRAQDFKQAAPVAPAPAAADQAAPAPAATDQPISTSVVLPANQVWQAAATNLRGGGRLQITAQGEWTMRGQNQRFSAAQVASQYTGPDGYPNLKNERALLPSANIGALIGRIGQNGTPFLIGAAYDQPITTEGVLFVAMNDIVEQYQDNQGRMSIQVTVSPPPPPPEATPEAQTPAPDTPVTTTTVAPAPAPQATTPSLPFTPTQIRTGLIAIAVLLGLIFLGRLFRGGGKDKSKINEPPEGAAQITTRVAADGVSSQLLKLTVKGR